MKYKPSYFNYSFCSGLIELFEFMGQYEEHVSRVELDGYENECRLMVIEDSP